MKINLYTSYSIFDDTGMKLAHNTAITDDMDSSLEKLKSLLDIHNEKVGAMERSLIK